MVKEEIEYWKCDECGAEYLQECLKITSCCPRLTCMGNLDLEKDER